MSDGTNVLEWIKREASRCAYCGFCESVCPTSSIGFHRGYGPRGRLFIASILASGGQPSEEALASIFSCLSCRACIRKCPASIDVPLIVREIRALYNKGVFRRVEREIPIRMRPGV